MKDYFLNVSEMIRLFPFAVIVLKCMAEAYSLFLFCILGE